MVAAGVRESRRAGEAPARMFAGEGDAFRTNRRFQLLSRGNDATRLSTALGPQGANKTGSVGRLLQTSAANLDGRGPDIKRTLVNLSKALSTGSVSRVRRRTARISRA